MMILAYYIFIDLLSSTSGQTVQLSLSKAYVNTSDPVTITCSVAVVIIDTVVISKDGINIFRCPSPPISCSNLGIVSAYSAVQNDTAGTTTMTISGSNISRDAGNWTCQYGTNFTSTPVSLAVVTPPSSSRLIEESGYIILELICTYPYISLDFQFYLGNDSYTEGNSNKTVTNASCTSAYEASVNYTLTFSQHSKSYSGTFNIFVNNGFYIARFIGARQYNFTAVTTTTEASTTTTTTTVTSSSTSMSSATSKVTNDNTSTKPTTTGSSASAASSTSSNVTTGNIPVNPTTNGSAASATNSTSTSMSPTAVSPANNTNNTSTSTNPTISGSSTTNKTTSNGSKSINSDIDIKVIVPAVVVPCGLLIIGVIILLVVLCVRRRAGKNVRESPDGMAVQDKGSNIDEWQQSLGHGKATDALYTTPDGFVIYPGPAAMSAARSYKDKKYHSVTDQYSRPYPGTYHNQSAYIPSIYTSARAYTHKDKKRAGTYDYQSAYVPSTYMSARTYAQKGKSCDYEGSIRQPTSHPMATSRPAYDQTAYYPQTGYYGHSGEDVYYSGGGQYSYGHRSRSHHDHNGRKQQREYYNQYEMEDYGGNRAGYRHTKQDMAFYY